MDPARVQRRIDKSKPWIELGTSVADHIEPYPSDTLAALREFKTQLESVAGPNELLSLPYPPRVGRTWRALHALVKDHIEQEKHKLARQHTFKKTRVYLVRQLESQTQQLEHALHKWTHATTAAPATTTSSTLVPTQPGLAKLLAAHRRTLYTLQHNPYPEPDDTEDTLPSSSDSDHDDPEPRVLEKPLTPPPATEPPVLEASPPDMYPYHQSPPQQAYPITPLQHYALQQQLALQQQYAQQQQHYAQMQQAPFVVGGGVATQYLMVVPEPSMWTQPQQYVPQQQLDSGDSVLYDVFSALQQPMTSLTTSLPTPTTTPTPKQHTPKPTISKTPPAMNPSPPAEPVSAPVPAPEPVSAPVPEPAPELLPIVVEPTVLGGGASEPQQAPVVLAEQEQLPSAVVVDLPTEAEPVAVVVLAEQEPVPQPTEAEPVVEAEHAPAVAAETQAPTVVAESEPEQQAPTVVALAEPEQQAPTPIATMLVPRPKRAAATAATHQMRSTATPKRARTNAAPRHGFVKPTHGMRVLGVPTEALDIFARNRLEGSMGRTTLGLEFCIDIWNAENWNVQYTPETGVMTCATCGNELWCLTESCELEQTTSSAALRRHSTQCRPDL